MDLAERRINNAIADAIAAGELSDDSAGMPATWVLVGTYYDSDGEPCSFFLANEKALTHESLGLLDLGRIIATERTRRWAHEQYDSLEDFEDFEDFEEDD